jgi:amidophosphoribosyltransferase
MCGVIGIIGREPVAPRLIEGLKKLENRGLASAGYATYDKKFYFCGKTEPATFAFSNINPDSTPGNLGIGHTRYPTTGSEDKLLQNMQPVEHETIMTASNGDLVNIISQRERLKKEGFSFEVKREGKTLETEVDAKVIQNTLLKYMQQEKINNAERNRNYFQGLCECISKMHDELNGAYSAVNITERGMIAFRDPHGIRPLCMAERREKGEIIEYIIASESSVINYFGDYQNIRSIEPGEVVFIDTKRLRPRSKTVKQARKAFCFLEFNYFAMPDSEFENRKVEVVRAALGLQTIKEFKAKYGDPAKVFDYIFGIPTTADSAGAAAANHCGIPAVFPVKKRIGLSSAVRTYQQTSQMKRLQSILEKFIYIMEYISGKRLASMDDTNVRGNTARAHNRNFARLGAADITNLFYTPQIRYPCYYGQDYQTKEELIAARCNGDLAKISDETEADHTFYNSIEGMLKAIGIPREELCLACLTGEYPTDITEAQERSKLRTAERTHEKLK